MKPGSLPLPRDYADVRRRLVIYQRMIDPLINELVRMQICARPTYLYSAEGLTKVSDNYPPAVEQYISMVEEKIADVRAYLFGNPPRYADPDPRIVRKYLQYKLTPAPPAAREWYRASGQALCPECGYEYIHHPMDRDPAATGYDGQPINHILCNGDRVHL